ncbi:hypothetical protein L208DRAFT_1395288 [Tricholoma matsutake]|nr:hypothetical protein L208DRAFT_1395288 [Tricholoma matsutake 945]
MAQTLYFSGRNGRFDPIEAAGWQASQVSIISLMNLSTRIFIGKSFPLYHTQSALISDQALSPTSSKTDSASLVPTASSSSLSSSSSHRLSQPPWMRSTISGWPALFWGWHMGARSRCSLRCV